MLAEAVAGMTTPDEEDRMPLSEALRQIEGVLSTHADAPPTAIAVESAPVTAATPEPRLCMICMMSERSVRFGCGHSACCDDCVELLRTTAEKHRRDSIDPQLSQPDRERAHRMGGEGRHSGRSPPHDAPGDGR